MHPPRIIVIDDEKIIRLYVRRLVIKAVPGAVVMDVESAEEAWDYISSGDADLLITDCNLLGASGPDLVRNIREQKIPLPVIMISGSDTNRIHGEEAGVDQFIEKAFLDQELGPTIHSLLPEGDGHLRAVRPTVAPEPLDGELL